jgi:acetylornithine deacetylase
VSKLAHQGIQSIVIGPGSIDQAHAAIEYVDCLQVEQAVEFLPNADVVFRLM